MGSPPFFMQALARSLLVDGKPIPRRFTVHISRIDPLPKRPRPYPPAELTAKLNELIRAHNELEYYLEALVETSGRILLYLEGGPGSPLSPLFDEPSEAA